MLRTDEQEMFCQTARGVIERHVTDLIAECEREQRFPREIIPAFSEAGLLGGTIPSEYGGGGLDHVSQSLVIEEVSCHWQVLGSLVAMASGPVGRGILTFGTDDQRERFLQPLTSGESLAGYALTEAHSGTDAAAMTTKARRDGNSYVITGSKIWIDWATDGDFFLTFARTDEGSSGARGISAFIVEKDTPGFSTLAIESKMGLRSLTVGELHFDECPVPAENRLGDEGEGFKIAMSALEEARLGVAARAVGGIRACLESSTEYSNDRHAFGRPLSAFQLTQAKIADMIVAYEASMALTIQAAELLDAGRPAGRAVLAAKLYAQEAFMQSSHDAVQIFGAYGMSEEYTVNRMFRDAKVTEVTGGTNEILRILLAENELGTRST